ncbi:MAG: hypothetical protein CVV46_13925 [Spirochaetae bacterium HGW-Spirochaetae-2]|nr:MAG: hypothetical protein CVV46_13925 [Spirochaetae bacterium HGW-Spirochaetae-2]
MHSTRATQRRFLAPMALWSGEAFVEDCDCCPLKICVSMGRIHRAGQWIICLPNQIFVWIEGTPSDTSIDDIAS